MPSTVIAAIEYDEASRSLLVRYVSGLAYCYKAVPEKVFKEFKAAGSKGRYLNFNIKGKYEFERVD